MGSASVGRLRTKPSTWGEPNGATIDLGDGVGGQPKVGSLGTQGDVGVERNM